MLEELNNLIDDLEWNNLTKEQKELLRDNYNMLYARFQYCKDSEGNIVLKLEEDSFKRIEYYLGMEYERNDIAYKIQIDENIVVAYYSDNDRLKGIIKELKLFK